MIFFVLIFSLLLAVLLLSGAFLHSVLLCFVPVFIFSAWKMKAETRIIFVLSTLPFPFVIPFMGKDGGTITTLLVLFFSLLGIFELLIRKKALPDYSLRKWVLGLAVLGILSFLTSPSGISITSIRYLYVYLSGLCLFMMVCEAFPSALDFSKIGPLMDFLFGVVSGLVVIGLLMFFYPPAQGWFDIFLKADQELAAQASEATVKRLRTLITGPEPTGELLAVISPLVLSQFLLSKKKRYLFYFLLFLVGELLTATRSTIFLFALASLMTLFYFTVRLNTGQGLKAFGALVLGSCLLLTAYPQILSGVIERTLEAKTLAQSGGGLSEVLNRDSVWANALFHLKKTPLFGNGFLPASYYSENAMNFHNLYLTILFQLGWFGAPFYFLVLITIYSLLWTKRFQTQDLRKRFFLTACLISLSFFLLNEMKYEFNRHQPYSQFCWVLLALFYLASKIPSKPYSRTYLAGNLS